MKEQPSELIIKVREGDRDACRRLYLQYAPRLMATCTRYIPDRDDAEDVLQEALVKIFSSIRRLDYRGEAALFGWMKRIVANESLMFLRRQRKMLVFESPEVLPDLPEDDDPPPRVPPEVVQRLIQELPDGYRAVFNLAVFEELPHTEIASLLGISPSTSASQFHRARALLRRKIESYLRTEEEGITTKGRTQ